MKKIIVFCLILSILVISGCDGGITGDVPAIDCPQYGCRLTTKEASLESKVLDNSGNGCLTDCNADIYVKNLENQPVRAVVKADCNTVNKRAIYSSETYWLQPKGDHKFNIKVDAGLTENWKCENFVIHSEKISDCQTYIK